MKSFQFKAPWLKAAASEPQSSSQYWRRRNQSHSTFNFNFHLSSLRTKTWRLHTLLDKTISKLKKYVQLTAEQKGFYQSQSSMVSSPSSHNNIVLKTRHHLVLHAVIWHARFKNGFQIKPLSRLVNTVHAEDDQMKNQGRHIQLKPRWKELRSFFFYGENTAAEVTCQDNL